MNSALNPKYLLLLSAFALASCSQEDTPALPDGDSKQIVFRTSLPGLVSRAEVIDAVSLPHFYVSAFDFDDPTMVFDGVMQALFSNEKVELNPGKNFHTSPNCCWPDQGKESHTVSFFGFYPGPAEVPGAKLVNTSTAGTLYYKLTGFRVEPDIADQLDFVTAHTTGTMADNLFSGVTLPFVHQLSRIEINACGTHKSCDIEIAGVRIGGTGVEGTFEFKHLEAAGKWVGEPARGIVEYVFRKGDKIVNCGANHPVTNAVSIMGSQHDGSNGAYDNCAMLLPSTYTQWDYARDRNNTHNQMYISVLLRVTDATPTAGINPVEKQRYPYKDLSQGANSLEVPVVYLAVEKATGTVSSRLYTKDGNFYTDPSCETPYTHPATEEIKDFGWAALPVEGSWKPGYIYSYTLDYTEGVGLLDPEVTTGVPTAGDPVISDRVGLTYTVKEWISVEPGPSIPVPGS